MLPVPARAAHPSRRSARGFTLIEMMIAVGIVGVLAVCAYAGYHKYVVTSHQAEAHNVLSGIKSQQDRYQAETGNYMSISPTLATSSSLSYAYPHCMMASIKPPGAYKVTWPATACTTCCNSGTDWLKLDVQVTAPTFYGYSTVAGASGTFPTTATTNGLTIYGATPNWPVTGPAQPWFVATAIGDVDGDGIFETEMLSSVDNQIYIDNDGE